MDKKVKFLDKLINRYRTTDYYIGSIVSGSFVTNTIGENSDIDLHIILNPNNLEVIKGWAIIDGHKVSYLAAGYKYFLHNLQIEPSKGTRVRTSYYAKGYIIEDTSNMIKSLVSLAHQNIKTPFNQLNISDKLLYKKMALSFLDRYKVMKEPYKSFFQSKIVSHITEWYLYLLGYGYIGSAWGKIDLLDTDDDFAQSYGHLSAIHSPDFFDIASSGWNDHSIERLVYTFIDTLGIDDIDLDNYEVKI